MEAERREQGHETQTDFFGLSLPPAPDAPEDLKTGSSPPPRQSLLPFPDLGDLPVAQGEASSDAEGNGYEIQDDRSRTPPAAPGDPRPAAEHADASSDAGTL